jgi:hypothetical protein
MKRLPKILIVVLMATMTISVMAQEEEEYKMSVGGGIGLVSYEGDFNGSILKDAQPMGSLIARWNLNPRMAIKADLTIGKLKGSSSDVTTYYPGIKENPISFDKSLYDLTARYEYNFWGYGMGQIYRNLHRIVPYMALGAGFTFVDGNGANSLTMNIPIGIGLKYKIAERLNIGAEWVMHFSMSDKLDGVKDPYGIKSSGIFKNTDCYSALQLSLTYDIMPKCKTCHNADEN